MFHQLEQEKTAIIIRHWLTLARIATNVIVMERDQIVEQGTHDELMNIDQYFWSMFTRQACSYLESNASVE